MPNFKNWKSQQLQRLRLDSERMFDRLCADFGLPSVCRPLLEPNLSMTDTRDSVVVEAVLPGMKPEDMSIFVEEDILVVRCEHHESCAEASGSSVFEQRFRLPCKVRAEEVKAEFDGEKLTITMPKCKRPEMRRIPVVFVKNR